MPYLIKSSAEDESKDDLLQQVKTKVRKDLEAPIGSPLLDVQEIGVAHGFAREDTALPGDNS